MEIRIPFGFSSLTATIPDQFNVDIIEAPDTSPPGDASVVVYEALNNLIGNVHWNEFAGARSVAIAINDKTRPVPHHQLLPLLLEQLAALGIPDEAISFYIAGGTHPPMSAEKYPAILPPEILERYQVISHNSEDKASLIFLGNTSRNTPIWCNKGFAQSDLKIVVGNIEPHQFAGFSGGVKSAAIGLAGIETININHALMTHPDSRIGEYETNPARQDIEEIGQKIGIHIALNAILNQSRQIVRILAGEPHAVMQAGIPLSKRLCQAAVSSKYNLIISSPGGHPKDINLYQAQKALAHTALIMQTGGTVILTAACPEGTGSPHYEAWMKDKQSYAEVLDRFAAEGFRIGPHKAYQIARDASRLRLLFYSEMDSTLARSLLLNPVPDLQTAIDIAVADLQSGAHIGILPHASSTIPYLSK
jgi:nickel-dependent lactate racemase